MTINKISAPEKCFYIGANFEYDHKMGYVIFLGLFKCVIKINWGE